MPQSLHKQAFALWVFVIVGLIALSFLSGNFGHIGIDSDDKMRLVQIRDLYQGQSWFDLHQYRMGPDGGTLMHWSRVVDLPLITLIWLFDLVLPYERAEQIAFTLWPPMTSGLVIWGVLVGAKHMGGAKARGFAVLLLALWLIPNVKFAPGGIDHHNLQLGFLAICIGYALDPSMKVKSYVVSALALVMSIAIGAEINVFAAIICAFFALNWLFRGQLARRATIAFGLVLTAAFAFVFAATVAPKNYGVVACDAFSIFSVLAGGLGGLCLATSAFALSHKDMKFRLLGLVITGVLCGVFILVLGPQCLNNPLDSLPVDVKELWLGNVTEAQPLFSDRSTWLSVPPYALGAPFLALCIAMLAILRRRQIAENALLAFLIVSAVAMCLYQIRFTIFGVLFSMFVLPAWVAQVQTQSRVRSERSIAYLPAFIASIPMFWGIPGQLVTSNNGVALAGAQGRACYSQTIIDAANTLEPGLFSIPPNGAPFLLLHTDHRVLSGNYHRNFTGIQAQISAMTLAPAPARDVLLKAKVDYLFFCKSSSESLSHYAPEGLEAQIEAGSIPSFLVPAISDIPSSSAIIYRVVP